MIAVILTNVVLSALVVVVIVGSLAYSIAPGTPLRIRRRVVQDGASRLPWEPGFQRPTTRA